MSLLLPWPVADLCIDGSPCEPACRISGSSEFLKLHTSWCALPSLLVSARVAPWDALGWSGGADCLLAMLMVAWLLLGPACP